MIALGRKIRLTVPLARFRLGASQFLGVENEELTQELDVVAHGVAGCYQSRPKKMSVNRQKAVEHKQVATARK